MSKAITALVAASLISTPALGQVRPQDCRPMLPVVDDVAAVVQPDVVANPAAPAAVARRGFFGLPFLLPLLALAGGAAAIATTGGDDDPVSPA